MDYIEYLDKDSGKVLKTDYSALYLPNLGDFLLINGYSYRVVDIKDNLVDIHEIKEHGGSDFEEYALVTVKKIR